MSPSDDAVGQADAEAALAGYGDAVEMAVRVPTLAGVAAGLLIAAVVTLWRALRRRASSH